MWMEGNSSLWPNEPPRNGLVLPVGVLAAVRIPGQTLPEDCEKKRERESLLHFQNTNRSNSSAMWASFSFSHHWGCSPAAVCCWQVTGTVRVDLPKCPTSWGVFPEVWSRGCVCLLQRIFFCTVLERFNTWRRWIYARF